MQIVQKGNQTLAIAEHDWEVSDTAELLDRMVSLSYEQEIDGFILWEQNLGDRFFSLKTGYAGELLQKCSNYRIKIAIVGEFSKFPSKALQDFMRECNRGHQVFFKPTLETAAEAILQA